MWKLPDQGLKLSHSSDNTGSLAARPPGNSHMYIFFCPFRATPSAYGSSQARGGIRAAAACLHHSHSNTQFLNPLKEARDY